MLYHVRQGTLNYSFIVADSASLGSLTKSQYSCGFQFSILYPKTLFWLRPLLANYFQYNIMTRHPIAIEF